MAPDVDIRAIPLFQRWIPSFVDHSDVEGVNTPYLTGIIDDSLRKTDTTHKDREDNLGPYYDQKQLDEGIISQLARRSHSDVSDANYWYLEDLDFSNGGSNYRKLLQTIRRLYRALAFSIQDMKRHTTPARKLI